jgi:hypothetical protein
LKQQNLGSVASKITTWLTRARLILSNWVYSVDWNWYVNNESTPHAQHIHITDYKFERVSRFVYLGSIVNETKDTKEEISRRIQNANRCCYGLLKQSKSRLLTRETYCRLNTTPVLTYASETWTLKQSDIAHRKSLKG